MGVVTMSAVACQVSWLLAKTSGQSWVAHRCLVMWMLLQVLRVAYAVPCQSTALHVSVVAWPQSCMSALLGAGAWIKSLCVLLLLLGSGCCMCMPDPVGCVTVAEKSGACKCEGLLTIAMGLCASSC